MDRYRLNDNPGEKWVYYAESPEGATREYLHQAGFASLEDYQIYCKACCISPELKWKLEENG